MLGAADMKLIMPIKANDRKEAFSLYTKQASFRLSAKYHYVVFSREEISNRCIWPNEKSVKK